MLGDAGVGGERSSGHGQFELEVVDSLSLTEPSAEEGQGYVTVSLYWPTRSEVKDDVLKGASYGLVNRRGWLGSPDGMNLRRCGVRMLAEGSVLRKHPVGALANVKPLDPVPGGNVPHDVWRYGVALPLRCRIPDEEEEGDG
jgi:CRISPR-associated protein Csm4